MGNCLSGEPEKQPAADSKTPAAAATAVEQPCFPPVNKGVQLFSPVLGSLSPTDVTEHYEIGEVLGAGQFGTTRLAVHKATGQRFAVKSIMKSRLVGMEATANVRQELQIMHHMAGHPNVVSLKEAFEDHAFVHLILELCSGGDLVTRIVTRGHYTERDAASLIRVMLKVVAYCHEMGVVHRDLKPDNFLLADDSDAAALKATDFGLSCFHRPGQPLLRDVCGTAYYVAPEILMREYDARADVWAVGVILFVLLCGRPPFDHARDDDIFRAIMEDGQPDFSSHVWQNITAPAKDCVRAMMTWDFKQRPSAREMLEHEWVREGGVAGDNLIEPEVLHRMRSFASMNKLKKQALLFIAQSLSVDEIRGLRELFNAMDTDGSGTISADELRRGLQQMGAALPEAELHQLMALCDVDHSQELDIEEFISATIHTCKLQREESLVAAFKHFDEDGDGFITRGELSSALRAQSRSARELEVDIAEVLRESDADQDGRISFTEFCSLVLPTGSLSNCGAAKFAAQLDGAKPQPPAGHAAETAPAADQAAARS